MKAIRQTLTNECCPDSSRARAFVAMTSSKALCTGSFTMIRALFCDICGRELQAGAKFCDVCGRKLAVEEQPATYPTATDLTRPSVAVIQPLGAKAVSAREGTPAAGDRPAKETVESRPPESRPPQRPPRERRRLFLRGRRFSRRFLIFSAVGLAAVAIIVVSLVATPILSGGILPGWQGTTTSSQTAASSTTGGVLSVQINIANDPTTIGSVQTIKVTVLDPSGHPVPEATVHLEVTSPSGHTDVSERSTDAGGACTFVWQIPGLPDNVGTFQVKASAAKAGYVTAQAEATFQANEAAP